MSSEPRTRRDFVRDTAVAAGAAMGLAALASSDARATEPAQPAAAPKPVDTAKILNYNPKMEYRRQGKTELMVSAVCLGGHSRSDDKTRAEIISRCIELGINYIDACTDGEVRRDAKALRGRRDKMYLALSDCGHEVRNEESRTAKKLLEVLDDLLKASGQEYTDLWRITCLEPGGRHTFDTACEIVDALEKAKKQGKARFGGFSSHDRRWIKFMIEYFPQIDVVCFPFTTMTKAAPKDSLFPALKKFDVGAFGIKPFAAGSLFTGEREEDFDRARLAIRYILRTKTVIPIPGIHSVAEADNLAQAVTERRELDMRDKAAVSGMNRDLRANLPRHYEWLTKWEYV
jgi:aryl-alcohol dehydrogenase-like predicted oxidoreductase